MGGLFNMVMNSALIKNLPYDPIRDFTVVDYISAYPFILLARKDLPVATLADFAAYAKERPGQLNYASAGLGTLQHVWGAILTKSMGLDLQHIPYRGVAAAQQDMIGGRVDVLFDNLSSAKQLVQSGQLKGLAVSSEARTKALPDVPTIIETGVTKFTGESWFGMFAPQATPQTALDALRKAVASVTADPEFVAAIERDAGRILSIPPADRAAWLKHEVERWSAMVAQFGVQAQ
jgi:tripartite-type tricarboxylate transporter receptor subunit TctC